MNHQDEFRLKKIHYFGINLKANLYQELIHLSCGDLNAFLEYLYEKYKNRILQLKIAPVKGTATAEYQPRDSYKKVRLRKIKPTLWQSYWELRLLTGYTISYIIRVFLEWELRERGKEVESLLPAIEIEGDRRLRYRYPSSYVVGNRYSLRRVCERRQRKVYVSYWDDS